MINQQSIHVITVFNTFGEIVFSSDDRESFIDFCEDVPKGYNIKRVKCETTRNPYSGKKITVSEYTMRPKGGPL